MKKVILLGASIVFIIGIKAGLQALLKSPKPLKVVDNKKNNIPERATFSFSPNGDGTATMEWNPSFADNLTSVLLNYACNHGDMKLLKDISHLGVAGLDEDAHYVEIMSH